MSGKNTNATARAGALVQPGPPPKRQKTILEREIPSDVALAQALVVRTVEFLKEEAFFLPKEETQVALCISEALTNAVVHGNGKDFSKKVRLEVFLSEQEWGLVISDQGEGFDVKKLQNPLENDSLWTESGRGVYLMVHYMDRVEYYENGSVIVMAKRL